jgi:hypothetical protein
MYLHIAQLARQALQGRQSLRGIQASGGVLKNQQRKIRGYTRLGLL